MTIPTFLLQRHQYLHQQFFPNLRKTLPEADFRRSPVDGFSPIIWHTWHIARVEDMGLSRFIWGKPQLYDAAWREKIGTSLTHYGTSMTDEEVAELAAQVDVYAVLDYLQVVGERTREELGQLDLDLLDKVMDEATVRRVVTEEGMASPTAQWVIPHYVGKTYGWLLCHMGLSHSFRHFGQIALAKKLLLRQA